MFCSSRSSGRSRCQMLRCYLWMQKKISQGNAYWLGLRASLLTQAAFFLPRLFPNFLARKSLRSRSLRRLPSFVPRFLPRFLGHFLPFLPLVLPPPWPPPLQFCIALIILSPAASPSLAPKFLQNSVIKAVAHSARSLSIRFTLGQPTDVTFRTATVVLTRSLLTEALMQMAASGATSQSRRGILILEDGRSGWNEAV